MEAQPIQNCDLESLLPLSPLPNKKKEPVSILHFEKKASRNWLLGFLYLLTAIFLFSYFVFILTKDEPN